VTLNFAGALAVINEVSTFCRSLCMYV
jgi:hypothetical protein